MKRFVLGLDMDGVITRHPDHLRWLSDRLMMSGHSVHVITGRMEKERTSALKELKGLHFRYSELHCYPGAYEYKGEKLHVDDMTAIGEWKAAICDELGVQLFLDDNMHWYPDVFDVAKVHI